MSYFYSFLRFVQHQNLQKFEIVKLLLIGNLQKAIEDDPDFDENVIVRSDGKNKYFLNDPIPVSEGNNEDFPAWYGRSIEDIILDSSSIQETFLTFLSVSVFFFYDSKTGKKNFFSTLESHPKNQRERAHLIATLFFSKSTSAQAQQFSKS